MWTKHKITLIVAIIGAVTTIIAALIGILPQLISKDDHIPLQPPIVPEPKEISGMPRFGTAVQYQGLVENFRFIGPGWDLDKTKYLKDQELHIFKEKANSGVHACFNTLFALGTGYFEVAIDARQISGPHWSYGIVLKVMGEKDFIFFAIRSDGFCRITRFHKEAWHDYSDWQPLNLPISSKAQRLVVKNFENRYSPYDPPAIIEQNTELIFSINNSPVTRINNEWQDKFFQVGLFSTLDIHAAFDNLKINDYSGLQGRKIPASPGLY